MVRGLFITNFTLEEVTAIQAKAKALLLEGKTIMSWGDSETSVTKQFTLPVDQILEECAHALKVLCPSSFGRDRIATSSRISGFLAK